MSSILHIYTRVSSASQEDEGTSLETQREMGLKRAEVLGMEARVWNEGGQSSKYEDFGNRPQLAELLSEITAGRVQHLWVYNTDRLSRNEMTWSVIRMKLLKHDVRLYTATGTFNLSNAQDKMLFGILQEISAYDNALRTERTRLGRVRRLREGCWKGGMAPFGYKIEKNRLVVEKEEAKWVNFIFEEYVRGSSVHKIRQRLLEAGVKSRLGRSIWSTGSLQALLDNTHYVGWYKVTDRKSGEVFTLNCEAIISEALRDSYLASLKKRSVVTTGRGIRRNFYLLREFLVCDHCGRYYGGRIYQRQYRAVYYCPGRQRGTSFDKGKRCANGAFLHIEDVDQAVWKGVVDVLSQSHGYKEEIKRVSLGSKGSIRETKSEIRLLKKRKRTYDAEMLRLRQMAVAIDARELLSGRDGLHATEVMKIVQEKIAELKAQRSEATAKINDLERASRWTDWVADFGQKISELQSLKREDQREFLRGIVSEIRIKRVSELRMDLHIRLTKNYVEDRLVKTMENGVRRHQIEDGRGVVVVPIAVYDKRITSFEQAMQRLNLGSESLYEKNTQ